MHYTLKKDELKFPPRPNYTFVASEKDRRNTLLFLKLEAECDEHNKAEMEKMDLTHLPTNSKTGKLTGKSTEMIKVFGKYKKESVALFKKYKTADIKFFIKEKTWILGL